MKDNEMIFCCPGLNKDEKEVADIFDDFLLDLSKESNVFLHTYRLCDINGLVDPKTVQSRADIMLDPHNSYFHLTEAKVKSGCFADGICCEAEFFFCKKDVKLEDFLATSAFEMRKKLLKSGLLSAVFYVCDHGADFVFECNKSYIEKVFDCFNILEKLGWRIKREEKLEYQK